MCVHTRLSKQTGKPLRGRRKAAHGQAGLDCQAHASDSENALPELLFEGLLADRLEVREPEVLADNVVARIVPLHNASARHGARYAQFAHRTNTTPPAYAFYGCVSI